MTAYTARQPRTVGALCRTRPGGPAEPTGVIVGVSPKNQGKVTWHMSCVILPCSSPKLLLPKLHLLRPPSPQSPLSDRAAPIGLDVDVAAELAKVLREGLDHLVLVGGSIDQASAILAIDQEDLVRHRIGPSRFPVIQLDDSAGLVVLVVVGQDVVPDGEAVSLAWGWRRTVVVQCLLGIVVLFPLGDAALFELLAGTARTWFVPGRHSP